MPSAIDQQTLKTRALDFSALLVPFHRASEEDFQIRKQVLAYFYQQISTFAYQQYAFKTEPPKAPQRSIEKAIGTCGLLKQAKSALSSGTLPKFAEADQLIQVNPCLVSRPRSVTM